MLRSSIFSRTSKISLSTPPPSISSLTILSPLAATAASLSSLSPLTNPTTIPSYTPYTISKRTYVKSTHTLYVKNPFRSFLRSRIAVPEGSIGNQRTGGFDLFHQDNIPKDLQLPKPGDPFYRFGAALFDGILSSLGGLVTGGIVYYCTQYNLDIAIPTGQATTLVLWILRDAFGDEGNRSIGKRLFNLEITNNDGTLINNLWISLFRNWYFGLVPILTYHPLINMTFEVCLFFDAASFLLTPDARRVGDYIFGSRVVEERPNRTERIQDMYEQLEMIELRNEIEKLAPGTLNGLRNHPIYGNTVAAPWYDGIQAKLHADTIAKLKADKDQEKRNNTTTSSNSQSIPQSMVYKGEQLSTDNNELKNEYDTKNASNTGSNESTSIGGLGGLFSEVKGFQEGQEEKKEEMRKKLQQQQPQFVSQRPKKSK